MSTYYVKVYYGPVESFNLSLEHRPQFLKGLRMKLQQHGFRVDLIPVEFDNYCMLAICGYTVFHCNIRNLLFNTPAEQDPVCLNAVDAVLEAHAKLNRTRCYLWIWVMLERQMFKRTEFASKAYWVADMPPFRPELADFRTCMSDCCKILTVKDEEAPEIKAPETDLERFCKEINRSYGSGPLDDFGDEQEDELNILEISGSRTFPRSGTTRSGMNMRSRSALIVRSGTNVRSGHELHSRLNLRAAANMQK